MEQLREITFRLLHSSDRHWLAPYGLGSTHSENLWRIVKLSILDELAKHATENEKINEILVRLNQQDVTPINAHPGWRIVSRSILKELTNALTIQETV